MEPTFADLAQLADACSDSGEYIAAARIYQTLAEQARRERRYGAEATALLFASRMQDEAAKAA